ncbi:hypothetical protein FJV46_05755 [Arthrobacter agilis]|uniref:hypothetical protein n=1 Tax=Arthrobacter agilis TaxID=37921 RepID=UPI000B34AEBB|nr:hypothetical protein [Arthrobacter agilis]OUM42290.1 hypothetical protein B8W74_09310 [Arthrobacter agilis]PPB45632.1 hypothetical protein CI784_11310 [Arthrobacter agilis]TPV26387.1 hypothetical protein FJV46_05755 [Arthrobacter agilis]VDR33720.1 Uncharacterised protein [Arthrobacter agilis]
MTDSQPLPAQFLDEPESSMMNAPPPSGESLRGELIIGGSLTPPDGATGGTARQDLPGAPEVTMPAFHRRADVQRLLARWRNGLSLCGRILSSEARGPWDDSRRFEQPNHLLHIR